MFTDAEREAVFSAAEALLPQEGPSSSVMRSYFQLVPTERLVELLPEDMAGMVTSHWHFAQRRQPRQDMVRVLTPTTAEDGWTSPGSVVEIVTDDRKFLVDSVRGALEALGLAVNEFIHPIFEVQREAGLMTSASLSVPGEEEMEGRESWMHVETSTISAEAVDTVTAALLEVLTDVRAAVDDWGQMSSLMWEAARHTADREQADLLRWLTEDEFTFLGRSRYLVHDDSVEVDPTSALGLARHNPHIADLPLDTPQRRAAWEANDVMVTEGSDRSTVQRALYHDIVTVKERDEQGRIVAEERFTGLLATTVNSGSTARIPVLRRVAAQVLDQLGLARDSHAGREALNFVDACPRQPLFHVSVEKLATEALEVRALLEHPRARVFCEIEPLRRFVTFVVRLPRDRYSTQTRLAITRLLVDAVNGVDVDFTTQVTASPLATLHFTIRAPEGTSIDEIDLPRIERELDSIGRDWRELLTRELRNELGEADGAEMALAYAGGFPTEYMAAVPAAVAAQDVRRLASLGGDGDSIVALDNLPGADAGERRLKLYLGRRATLSDLLPLFAHLGVTVTDERAHAVHTEAGDRHILDLGLRADEQQWRRTDDAGQRFEEAVRMAWAGRIESDQLQGLILASRLTSAQVLVLRAIVTYLRQLGVTYSPSFLRRVLVANPDTAEAIVELFETRFDPGFGGDRETACQHICERIDEQLNAVPQLDHERILAACRDVVLATVRTNFWLEDAEHRGGTLPVALKIATSELEFAPQPRPHREMWVYSPQVEGVHLRFGAVARGGLRWSDRREDFRTEVLGLVKAQVVKNAVIVPAGAKGGFFAKQAGSPAADRDAWFAAGTAAYRAFISAILSVADNREGDAVTTPEGVVRHDDLDPYLVVAADKGTATFSDVANKIALDRGFWLGDAFASGGSVGFDHKGMGITARGAWESVKRHFRERGVDTQTTDFTAVGIGDMSGDVFGNGMLCSEHIRLVAAFDHRHIFIDPQPDAATSYRERRRLFELPRSSWNDYDRDLISEGGGVFPRDAKHIDITEQMREALGITATRLSPVELIRAVLKAPVDLLWNGGIGTYVKASTETNGDVGDKANDAVRINGNDVRAHVVGEGGNLGFTQRGRVEAARNAVAIQTDAIDNSAGVDTSDHEVNIKIALGRAVDAGRLSGEDRDRMLHEMVDEVAHHVLRTNYEQNVLIGNARTQGTRMVASHIRLMHLLEDRVHLDRRLEALPSDDELRARAEEGHGLTSPEFSVLVAWTKISLKQALLKGEVIDDPACERMLVGYFPKSVVERFHDLVVDHPLRREIIANVVANEVVNRGGVSFVFRAMEEGNTTAEQAVRAFLVAREVFGLDDFIARVEALDNAVSTAVQADLYLSFRRLLDQSLRRLVARHAHGQIGDEVAQYAPFVQQSWGRIGSFLRGSETGEYDERVRELHEQGVPEDLAVRAAELPAAFALLDVIDLAQRHDVEPELVARVLFALMDRLHIGDLLNRIRELRHADQWEAMARNSARSDAYQILVELSDLVLDRSGGEEERIAGWFAEREAQVDRASGMVADVVARQNAELAPISVALRALRDLKR